MKKQYKDKFPKFCDEDKYYELALSDDSDSILVSNFLQSQNKGDIRYFYDFKMLYMQKGYKPKNLLVGCDIDFVEFDGMCWGNHVTAISGRDTINPRSANLNNINGITSKNYTNKYAGSTLATLLSYYDYDISQLSDEAKMMVLCIDSHFLGFYSQRFHNTQKKWLLDVLELEGLYDMILKYNKEDFERLQAKYNLKSGKIWIDEGGFLQTNIDLEGISEILEIPITLPHYQFEPLFKSEGNKPYLTLKTSYVKTDYISRKEQIQENILSYSQTYKNNASFTYLVWVTD